MALCLMKGAGAEDAGGNLDIEQKQRITQITQAQKKLGAKISRAWGVTSELSLCAKMAYGRSIERKSSAITLSNEHVHTCMLDIKYIKYKYIYIYIQIKNEY